MHLSQLEFSALLTYSPRGDSREIRFSKDVMLLLKKDAFIEDPPILMSQWIAEKIKKELTNLEFNSFFQPDITLIPTPKSSLMQPDTLWVPERIAKALVSKGLGKEVLSCLSRRTPIRKAARCLPSMRPKPIEHYESMSVQAGLSPPDEILLIDDIITRGATLLGAANRLADAFPQTRIRAFSVMRTISDPNDFITLYDPCKGTITLRPSGDTIRRP